MTSGLSFHDDAGLSGRGVLMYDDATLPIEKLSGITRIAGEA
jgi:hypothetical protein